mmetsp:Transcript_29786/g.46720  ORF Transcript_29786/g.46720 Transcript_29786/m.46720 type:complete len:233 (-) Transcript_29786:189-887(-)
MTKLQTTTMQTSLQLQKEQSRQAAPTTLLKIGHVPIAPLFYQRNKLVVGNVISGEVVRGRVGGLSRQRRSGLRRVIKRTRKRRRIGLIEHWIGRVVVLYCQRSRRGVANVSSGEEGNGCLMEIMMVTRIRGSRVVVVRVRVMRRSRWCQTISCRRMINWRCRLQTYSISIFFFLLLHFISIIHLRMTGQILCLNIPCPCLLRRRQHRCICIPLACRLQSRRKSIILSLVLLP